MQHDIPLHQMWVKKKKKPYASNILLEGVIEARVHFYVTRTLFTLCFFENCTNKWKLWIQWIKYAADTITFDPTDFVQSRIKLNAFVSLICVNKLEDKVTPHPHG